MTTSGCARIGGSSRRSVVAASMSSRPSWISTLVSTSHGACRKALGEAALEQSVLPFATATKRNSEQIPSVRLILVHEQTATVILAGIARLYADVHSRRTARMARTAQPQDNPSDKGCRIVVRQIAVQIVGGSGRGRARGIQPCGADGLCATPYRR